jgi:hypothetical protein
MSASNVEIAEPKNIKDFRTKEWLDLLLLLFHTYEVS